MQLRHHKAQQNNMQTDNRRATPPRDEPQATDLPKQADRLLEDPRNVQLFENVLMQINDFYDLAFNNHKEVLPIFVGVTNGGLMIELSAIRSASQTGQPISGHDLNIFTYQIGTDLHSDIRPREIAEVNMVRGQEQIRLYSEDSPMPDESDNKAIARWRFTEAETIQLDTMGLYEVQPENYDAISYGHGIEALGGTKEAILPLKNFKTQLK